MLPGGLISGACNVVNPKLNPQNSSVLTLKTMPRVAFNLHPFFFPFFWLFFYCPCSSSAAPSLRVFYALPFLLCGCCCCCCCGGSVGSTTKPQDAHTQTQYALHSIKLCALKAFPHTHRRSLPHTHSRSHADRSHADLYPDGLPSTAQSTCDRSAPP